MRRLATTASTILVMITLAACSNTAATAAAPASSTAAVCAESNDPGAVAVTMQHIAYSPDAITAKVGQVISFTNKENLVHDVALDDGSCTTKALNLGEIAGLVFGAPGSYPFHCNIHPAKMKGTIKILG